MAYKITRSCICCEACQSECPNEAITECESQYFIDPQRCTECIGAFASPRCADICPVEACLPDPDHVESIEELQVKWRDLYPRKKPAQMGMR